MASVEEFLKFKKQQHTEMMLDVKRKEEALKDIPFVENTAL